MDIQYAFSINFQVTIDFPAFWLVKIHWPETSFLRFLHSNKFQGNFCKVKLIIICKHLEIYTKTISRLRLGDYKPIFTSPSPQWV